MSFYLGLGTLFLEFSVLPQVLAYVFQVRLFLLYLIAIPAILAMVASGGLRRCFRARPAYYWTGFGCWIGLAAPFSTWPGGSVLACFDYWRTTLIILFVAGALIVDWSDVRKVMYMIAASAVVNILCARFLRMDLGERTGVALGTIGNPNDYAGHLLLVLPFLLWIVLSGKVVLRIVALGFVGTGVYLILGTASRGALLGLAAEVVFFAIMASGRQKAALVLVGPIAAMVLLATVPPASWRRLAEMWFNAAKTAESAEALESSEARQYLLRTSIRYTFERPLFGVGFEQFASYESGRERVVGTHGYGHETHNSFMQAAVECGIPGFLLFTGGIVSTLLLLYKTFRQARRRPDCQDIRVAVFCIMLGMAGFIVAITFLNFAYFFYLPVMGGLATGVWIAAQREFQLRGAALDAGAA